MPRRKTRPNLQPMSRTQFEEALRKASRRLTSQEESPNASPPDGASSETSNAHPRHGCSGTCTRTYVKGIVTDLTCGLPKSLDLSASRSLSFMLSKADFSRFEMNIDGCVQQH